MGIALTMVVLAVATPTVNADLDTLASDLSMRPVAVQCNPQSSFAKGTGGAAFAAPDLPDRPGDTFAVTIGNCRYVREVLAGKPVGWYHAQALLMFVHESIHLLAEPWWWRNERAVSCAALIRLDVLTRDLGMTKKQQRYVQRLALTYHREYLALGRCA